jgi:NAD(P)-dependent dehydrogenase (short-subunit alcohol dehydrogenase family)
MADEGGGVIVNIASTAGHPGPIPEGIGFVASQAGVIGLTRQSARELGPRGIRVNALCPANIFRNRHPTDSPNNALQQYGTEEDIANAALFLCSDAARFITGQAINVDGGESMV